MKSKYWNIEYSFISKLYITNYKLNQCSFQLINCLKIEIWINQLLIKKINLFPNTKKLIDFIIFKNEFNINFLLILVVFGIKIDFSIFTSSHPGFWSSEMAFVKAGRVPDSICQAL